MSFGGFGSAAPAAGGFGSLGGSTPAAGGFGSFGAAKPATTSFGGFGSPAATTAPASGFGAPATSGFGTPAAGTTGFGGFGGASPAKPAGFGSFGTPAAGTGAAPAATTSFGGFGTPAATATTTPAPSFGGFGAPAAASGMTGGFGTTPAAGGFGGFGTTPAKPAATAGFAGFGSPTPASTTTFGGFGTAAPASTGFGGFGTATPAATGFGAPGSVAATPANLALATQSVCELPPETPYNDLPPAYKAELDRTWKEMKQPMKQKLEEISRSRGSIFDDVHSELRRIHLAVLKVENEQRRLQGEIRPFLAELKQTSEVGRLQAAIGLQQIRNQGTGTLLSSAAQSDALRGLVDENLPSRWFIMVAEQLSTRLTRCVDTVHSYERQLATRLQALEQSAALSLSRGAYGQLRRVGMQELVALVQEQAKVFLQIAAAVAQVHQEADSMRQTYLQLIGAVGSGQFGASALSRGGRFVANPFEAADRKEAAEQRVLEQRMQAESHKFALQRQAQQQPAGAQGQGQPGAGVATPAASLSFGASLSTPVVSGFGTTAAATPAAATSGFGGFGATPAAAATPAATTGGFGALGGGFGSTPAAGGFGAAAAPAATTGGFGAASSSLGGKSSFAALDLATPSNGVGGGGFGGFGAPAAAPAAGGFGALGGGAFGGGFAASQAPTLGSSNPGRRTKNKK